jgi:hypothetical protein
MIMEYQWEPGWDNAENNNGASKEQVRKILMTAAKFGEGDRGLLEALERESNQIKVMKGIHQSSDLHITVDYVAETWHVNLVGTATGGIAGYRVSKVTKQKAMARRY